MSIHETVSWAEENQRMLTAALGRLRAHLEQKSQPFGRRPVDAGLLKEPSDSGAHPSDALPASLEGLCTSFGLSEFETDLLLLCAGVELDADFAELVTSLQPRGTAPTFGLALAALPRPHWSAITPGGPLRRWRFIDVSAGEQLITSPLRIDERVLHHLTGVVCPDEHLAGFIEPAPPISERMAPSQTAVVDALIAVWTDDVGPRPVLQLVGPAASSKRAVAVAVAERLASTVHVLPVQALPSGPHELDALMRLWEREAVLSRSVLLVEAEDLSSGDREKAALLRRFLEGTQAAILVALGERLTLSVRATVPFELRRPTAAEQRQVWSALLGERAAALNGQVDRLAGHFDLNVPGIEAAYRTAISGGEPSRNDLGGRIWDACRAQARPRLSDLAQTIPPLASWDDLVLPELQNQMLQEIALQVRERLTVYERWGFASTSARGLGISALFAGPSGTGKTMAAEVLAGALKLDLFRIDLSRVVSKYIGETEKNLARVFDAAEEGGAILLFDEADALFGKRSEVKDSHDRYANIEVSYLLQRMEAYRGLAILTTNLKNALDDAFLRRLRFVVTFPFPTAAQRALIWRQVFPAKTPTAGLDPEKLSRLNVAGGNIRNIALGAAFLAADDGGAVRMDHVLRAARTEYSKLERPLTSAETRGWT